MSDLRYAVRQLTRSPGFTLVVVLTLAIGIGANTALFSLGSAILAKPLREVGRPDRLTWIAPVSRSGQVQQMSHPAYVAYRDAAGAVFSGVAAIASGNFSIAGDAGPMRVNGAYVTANYFTVLQTHLLRGRSFAPDEDASPGGNPVAVIGERLWRERFNAREDMVGAAVSINGRFFSVVGIAPAAFNGHFHSERLDIWAPLSMVGATVSDRSRLLGAPGSRWLTAVGRLADGKTVAEATAPMAAVAARLRSSDSIAYREVATARLFPASTGMRPNDMQDVAPVATLAAAVTLLVLLIACANVSNLLLSRAASRRREIGVRLSLGASRGRVIRQLLAEAVMLAAAGAAVGFVIALWATSILASIIPAPLDVRPDWRVLMFTAAAAVVTGIGFGVVPALHATRADLAAVLKDAVVGVDRRRSRLQNGFVVAQLSLSLVLLTMAGMFLGSLYKASHMDVHFDASDRVIAASFDMTLQGYDSASARDFLSRTRAAVVTLPGVRTASMADRPPMGNGRVSVEVFAVGRPAPFGTASVPRGHGAYYSAIDPGFFATVGIPLVRGREFNVSDVAGAARVAIVSEIYARMIWADTNPVGRQITIDAYRGDPITVVGVAREAFTVGIQRQLEEPMPMVYRPLRQGPALRAVTVLLRADRDARPLAGPLYATFARLDPNLPLTRVQTLAAYRRDQSDESRLGSTLLAIFGGLALLLATVGIYAVMAFSVAQRRREIGVRVALGAAGSQIVRLFVGQALRLASIGILIGLAMSAAAAQLLATSFLGLSLADAIPVAAVSLVLGISALGASWLPARRASRVDPMLALRSD
jgi:predicted permease